VSSWFLDKPKKLGWSPDRAVFTHLMSKQSQILGALQVGLVALCAMAIYEITKLAAIPSLQCIKC